MKTLVILLTNSSCRKMIFFKIPDHTDFLRKMRKWNFFTMNHFHLCFFQNNFFKMEKWRNKETKWTNYNYYINKILINQCFKKMKKKRDFSLINEKKKIFLKNNRILSKKTKFLKLKKKSQILWNVIFKFYK